MGTVSLEETSRVKELIRTRCGIKTTEGMDGVGEGINGISVVEGLSTKGLVKYLTALKRSAVIYVGIRLDNPYQLLTGVVEVQLNLVGRGTNRFVTSELYLLDQVFVGVLCHLAALIGVKEDVVNIQGSGYKGLLVSSAYGLCASDGSKVLYGPEALTNGAEVNVNLDLVVLEGDKGKSKTRVAAEPELKGNVKGGLGESVTGSAYLGGSTLSGTGSRYVSESGVGDVCQLCGVANHLVVTVLLLLGESNLVPDVHPVTVLTVNALTSNLYLNLSNQLLTGEVQPTGMDGTSAHVLINLGKSDLKVSAVSKITVSADCASNTATEVSLSRESLFNALHGKVSVASVRHLPEGNFGSSCEEHVLSAIGDELHKSTSHS